MHTIEQLSQPTARDFAELGALLVDAVAGGASVNFVQTPSLAQATQWWRTALDNDADLLFVARAEGQIIGCVRLMPAPQPNGWHRAEVGKLLVRSDARRQGVATALMEALEVQAAAMGRTLLMLDTETGSDAEDFYRRCGWIEFGQLPAHTYDQRGELSGTTFFAKQLR